MLTGGYSDTFVNLSLAWASSLCLFWALVLFMIGRMQGRKSIVLFGGSLLLTSLYFAIISLSTGSMAGKLDPVFIEVARYILVADNLTKTVLTAYFLLKRVSHGATLSRA